MNVWEGEKAKTFMNKNVSTKRVQKNDFRSNRVRKLNEDCGLGSEIHNVFKQGGQLGEKEL